MIAYETVILACWAAFLVAWIAFAFNVKKDIRGGYGSVWQRLWLLRLVAAAVLLIIALRVMKGTVYVADVGFMLSGNAFPQSAILGWIAAALSVIGVSVAIWARVRLGRNWSPRPAVKEHHELVTSGPYAYVRHPIYTGIALMALGTALAGSLWSIFIFAIALAIFILRIGKEEKIMLELFPNEYPEYQKRTKRLVPFVW